LNTYEITFIIRPDLDDDGTRTVIDWVNNRIQSAGGEIIAALPWNPPRRRMAYPIREFGDGFYVTTTFQFPGQALREFENALKLYDRILRYLLVVTTEQQVRLAQHRLAQQAAQHAEAPSAPTAPPAPAATAPEGSATAPPAETSPIPEPAPEAEPVSAASTSSEE
jgi:small subunit ribosomal protein S6